MDFYDSAAELCLSGNPDGITGNHLGFTTHLVGLAGAGPGYGVQDTGVGFSWTTTWDGTNGGLRATQNTLPPDPGSGTGGISITKVNDVTTYQYPKGVGITAINGSPVSGSTAPPILLRPDQIHVYIELNTNCTRLA